MVLACGQIVLQGEGNIVTSESSLALQNRNSLNDDRISQKHFKLPDKSCDEEDRQMKGGVGTSKSEAA